MKQQDVGFALRKFFLTAQKAAQFIPVFFSEKREIFREQGRAVPLLQNARRDEKNAGKAREQKPVCRRKRKKKRMVFVRNGKTGRSKRKEGSNITKIGGETLQTGKKQEGLLPFLFAILFSKGGDGLCDGSDIDVVVLFKFFLFQKAFEILDGHHDVFLTHVAEVHRDLRFGADDYDSGVNLQVVHLFLGHQAAEKVDLFVHFQHRVVKADLAVVVSIHKAPARLLEVAVKITLALQSGNKQQSEEADQHKVDGLGLSVELKLYIFQHLVVAGDCIAVQDGFDCLFAVIAFRKQHGLAQIPQQDNGKRHKDDGDDSKDGGFHKTVFPSFQNYRYRPVDIKIKVL